MPEKHQGTYCINVSLGSLHAANVYAELFRHAVMRTAEAVVARRSGKDDSAIGIGDVIEAVSILSGSDNWRPKFQDRLYRAAWHYIQEEGAKQFIADYEIEDQPPQGVEMPQQEPDPPPDAAG